MKAKDKAEELIEKFKKETNDYDWITNAHAKQCALICVDYVINSNPHSNPFNTSVTSTMDFWQQVKQEILNRQ